MTAPVAATAARSGSTAAQSGATATGARTAKPTRAKNGVLKSVGAEAAKTAAARAITGGRKKNSGSSGGGGDGGGKRKASTTTVRRFLIAELMLCIMVIGLSPMVQKQSGKDFMKRGSALLAVFAILGMLSAIGPKSGKAAVAFGGLVTLGIFIDQRNLFGKVATVLSSGRSDAEPDGPIGGEIIQTV